jgi:hypothetical protein
MVLRDYFCPLNNLWMVKDEEDKGPSGDHLATEAVSVVHMREQDMAIWRGLVEWLFSPFPIIDPVYTESPRDRKMKSGTRQCNARGAQTGQSMKAGTLICITVQGG